MTFWSGEKLEEELQKGLIKPFSIARIDCASYQLCVGEQVFVTEDKFIESRPSAPLVSILGSPPHHTLKIPPGQFAFLITNEVVSVPSHALALISIRAKYKFRGLINVSGFHVDPGWEGKLLFSVYNAGASVVVIEKEEPLFIIVYADLDRSSAKLYNGKARGQSGIRPTLMEPMTSQVFSPLMLQRRMEELNRSLDEVKHTAGIVKAVSISATTVAGILLAAAALIATLAPSALGVILAKTIETAGYDLSTRRAEATPRQTTDRPLTDGAATANPSGPPAVTIRIQ